MVPLEGFEPPTLALRKPCSTAELQRLPAVPYRPPMGGQNGSDALNGFTPERQLSRAISAYEGHFVHRFW